MGMFVKKDNKNNVHVYVGKGIRAGEPFKGNKLRDKDGVKTYTHVKNGKVVRAAGVPGKRSPKW